MIEPAQVYIEELFKLAVPSVHQRSAPVFKAGVWVKDDNAPWIGQALVWKLQVDCHWDGLNEGPAAMFPVGNFNKGELYFPDLKLKQQYAISFNANS